tara:strand:- start:1562 stop:1765 length:204 start_codon:yes stop_codon:yes gene_type:complete
MANFIYDNADSFIMFFDEEWEKVECENLDSKIDLVIDNLSDHPFVKSNKKVAIAIANFRIKSLGKFK